MATVLVVSELQLEVLHCPAAEFTASCAMGDGRSDSFAQVSSGIGRFRPTTASRPMNMHMYFKSHEQHLSWMSCSKRPTYTRQPKKALWPTLQYSLTKKNNMPVKIWLGYGDTESSQYFCRSHGRPTYPYLPRQLRQLHRIPRNLAFCTIHSPSG